MGSDYFMFHVKHPQAETRAGWRETARVRRLAPLAETSEGWGLVTSEAGTASTLEVGAGPRRARPPHHNVARPT